MRSKMASPSCNISEFLSTCKGKDRIGLSLHAHEELYHLSQAIGLRQFYRTEIDTTQYDKTLGAFIWYIEQGMRPDFISDKLWHEFQSVVGPQSDEVVEGNRG